VNRSTATPPRQDFEIARQGRSLRLEELEARQLMSVTPIDTATQQVLAAAVVSSPALLAPPN